MSRLRLVGALVAGCVTALAVAALAFTLLRAAWPAYAAAEPSKAYTLGMLFARLGIAAILTAAAGWVAALVARDAGRAAWILGGLFLLISLPPHLYTVWDDYPAWYHFVYLLSLVPIAGLGGRLAASTEHG
jgi:hypothetical protein